ncbi:MAG TPA: hypothetical protein VHO69_11020 [Phototrophicaceae bacterium]|nr:hypothetical protein [Phototrophicaceae bacterium]
MSDNVIDRSHMLSPEEKRGRRGCLLPAWLLIMVFIFGIMVSCFGLITVISILTDQLWFVPGDASQFDPVARFDDIYSFAGKDYQFYTLDAEYVRSDGTLDLYANYQPKVTYRFVKETVKSGEARPIGAGGNTEGRQWEVAQVVVSRPFEIMSTSTGDGESVSLLLGMDRDVWSPVGSSPGEPVPPPTCSFKTLWDIAITQDAPREAVAVIRYDADGYNFRIEGLSTNLNFDRDCQLIE